MIHRLLSKVLTAVDPLHDHKREQIEKTELFDKVLGYEGIKRTFVRSLTSKEPVHILLVGPPGHAKTLFFNDLKYEKIAYNIMTKPELVVLSGPSCFLVI
ncbi:MAG: hypothetical protein WAJ93_25845 [Candidatus Nitrosopolaris sp.]